MKKFFSLLILIISLTACFYIYRETNSPKDPNNPKTAIFLVRKGEGAEEISRNLKNEDLIKSSLFFQMYVFLEGERNKLKAGKYELSPAMTVPEIVKKLVSGKTIKERITIIEGWNLENIGWYLEKKGISPAKKFFQITGFSGSDYKKLKGSSVLNDFSGTFKFLKDKPKNKGLEGYLFPDTYQINAEDNPEDIIGKMLVNFGKKLTPDLREKIAGQNKTIFEIVTMASLVEKEAKNTKDKKIISGILWKRLKYGIPLQVDATINYITGKKSLKVSKEETKIDSPYNTYKYKGLPAGPICNPGIESIIAAIEFQESPYLYYLSTPEGKIIFSRTLKEHNKAKAKYLKRGVGAVN